MRTTPGTALRRCVLALLPLLAACSGDDPRTVPVAARSETKATPATPAPQTDDAMAQRYLEIKERFAALTPEDRAGPGRVLGEVGAELRQIADTAKDVHLRANASLLLGTLYEAKGDARSAISFYRQVIALLPADAAPHRVLAMALATDKQYAEALTEMKLVVKDDPDDLEAWLMLGELAVKADEKETATDAYAGYEMRRKGLIDGISLKSPEGVFVIPAEQRAECARALIPARDNGTAIALIYALSIETEPAVRAAIVEAMGNQRLLGYKEPLAARLKTETAQEVKEAAAGDPKAGDSKASDTTASDTTASDIRAAGTKPADARSADTKSPGPAAPVPADRAAGTGAPAGATPPRP